MKKLAALLLALLMVISFTACKGNENSSQETTSANSNESATSLEGDSIQPPVEPATNEEGSVIAVENTTLPELTVPDEDPSKWTDEQIVEFYKTAAIRSKTAVNSQQTMTLESMVVNDGDGFLGTMVELVTPIMKAALKNSSTEFEGITGGYEALVVTDAQSMKAYKSGEYIVVEMTMKEQTDGIHGDTFSGTVGHAISVVGDIAAVQEALPQLVIDFDNADISLHYSNPKFKAKINKDGIIEKGTWTYTVNVDVKNLHVAGANIPLEATAESAHGTVGYIITVGGGF